MVDSTHDIRVVVTGLGIISSLGLGIKDFWKNLLAGKSGISPIETFDHSKYDRHLAGEIKNFDVSKFLRPRLASWMGRASHYALAASLLAFEDARLSKKEAKKIKMGVALGTTMGEPQALERFDEDFFLNGKSHKGSRTAFVYPASSIASNVAMLFKSSSRNFLFANACAASNYAIGYSYDLIKRGEVDYMLAGGSDALSRIAFTGFNRLFAMAPEKCQPFDKNRKGMMLGEGAAVLLLESLSSAQKRKANIYAEVMGYGLSCDACHMTAPSVQGILLAMKRAVEQSKIDLNDVGYVSAHGTGTKENDKAESEAIRKLLEDRAKSVPVSSIKSMLGHSMGAAAALEASACCLAIKEGKIPPTINHDEDDPECDIDCVPNKFRKQGVTVALNNSSAFGGNNCCVVFGKV